jgi:hypothetical protein
MSRVAQLVVWVKGKFRIRRFSTIKRAQARSPEVSRRDRALAQF